VCVNTKPGVNAFPKAESQRSPVPQAALGPPVRAASDDVVCGVAVMVHTTLSPAAIVVMAVTPMPPVLLVQSTNPISLAPAPPQGGATFPMLTAKDAARVREAPIDIDRLSIKSPMKNNFLRISNSPPYSVRFNIL
jgi:hypothetical protein